MPSPRLEGERYYDTFEKLLFETQPDLGWCHYGWLDLIYHRDPKPHSRIRSTSLSAIASFVRS